MWEGSFSPSSKTVPSVAILNVYLRYSVRCATWYLELTKDGEGVYSEGMYYIFQVKFPIVRHIILPNLLFTYACFHTSTLMRRVPDPDSPRWTHMALFLQSRDPSILGRWMDDYRFLAAYKLKASVSVCLSFEPCFLVSPPVMWEAYMFSSWKIIKVAY